MCASGPPVVLSVFQRWSIPAYFLRLYQMSRLIPEPRYVFSSGGALCMVTTVESLIVLSCSILFWAWLGTSARGSWKPFPIVLRACATLLDSELGLRGPKCMLV
uniref:Uncharacterized protein n=1 Tax=Anguilla anguilla TaxID=7936 RepID=A0A0E9T0R3_ANGAN